MSTVKTLVRLQLKSFCTVRWLPVEDFKWQLVWALGLIFSSSIWLLTVDEQLEVKGQIFLFVVQALDKWFIVIHILACDYMTFIPH